MVRYPLGHGVADQRILLVDDVCDTGDTFEVANKHLGDRIQPMESRTAVMHYKKNPVTFLIIMPADDLAERDPRTGNYVRAILETYHPTTFGIQPVQHIFSSS